MHGTVAAMIALGGVLFLLGGLGRLADRAGMSPVPLYLLGGVVIAVGQRLLAGPEAAGPDHGPFDALTGASALAGEIGVVLLLLTLGLEYSARELMGGLRGAWRAGLLDVVLNLTPGALAGLLLGWGPVGALVLGGITYISSSGIIAKVLADLGRVGNRETPVLLSVLVFEDLAMAVYLPLMTALVAGNALLAGLQAVGVALLVVSAVLFVALRFGPQVSKLVSAPDAETFLLTVLGLALVVAGVAGALQVSAGVGAFLLGIAISGAAAKQARAVLEPLRDLFAALFFVLFGAGVDPTALPPVLPAALALAVVTALTKVATGYLAAKAAGIGVAGRWRAGAALTIRGEFSIVIAGLAVAAGTLPPQVSAVATAYVLILAVGGPVLTRFADGFGRARARAARERAVRRAFAEPRA